MRRSASVSSTGWSSSRGTRPKSARSATSCAIFVPDGVTRWLKKRAAMSFCSGSSSSSAPSRCSSTMCCAPPSRSRVSARSVSDPSARSSSQIRCMTSCRYGASIRASSPPPSTAPSPPRAVSIRPVPTSSSTRSTRTSWTATDSPVSSAKRSTGRVTRARGLSIEAVEPQRVREEAGDAPREAVELRERVLPQRDQHVDPVRGRQDGGQRLRERARPAIVGVVQEVLLGLVEHEVHVAVGLRALECLSADPRPSPPTWPIASGETRIFAPAREDDDERLLGQLPKRAGDRRAQQRRLADTARPVEDGQPRGDEVHDDALFLALAAEEEQRVELRVSKAFRPLYGEWGARSPGLQTRLPRARRTPAGRRRPA